MFRIIPTLIVALALAPSTLCAQRQREHITFADVATLASAQSPGEVVQKDLDRYCFDELDAEGEAVITAGVRRRNPSAPPPTIIFEYIRAHPCEEKRPQEPSIPPRRTERPQPPRPAQDLGPTPPAPAELPTPTPAPPIPPTGTAYVSEDGRCLSPRPVDNLRRELRIPRFIRYMYVFVQTTGPVEAAESERLVAAIDKDEFIKCFETFREVARTRGMRLIITATDEGHRGWHQPEIRYRGRYLRVVEYKSPDGSQVFPGAEIPLN